MKDLIRAAWAKVTSNARCNKSCRDHLETKDVIRAAWAGVTANARFICIETYSGYRSSRFDPKGATHYLDANVSELELGRAFLDALGRSRFVLPAVSGRVWTHPDAGVDADLYDYDSMLRRYEDWVETTMGLYGYTSRRALFKSLKSCSATCQDGIINIQPMKKDKGEGWFVHPSQQDLSVSVAFGSSSEDVGAAVRLALSRCT